MLIQSVPDAVTKLVQLGNITKFEPSGDQPQAEQIHAPYQSHSLGECITNVVTPSGKKPILKAMMTTACERNCYYCPFRAGRSKTRRMTFAPDEMAKAFDALQRSKHVDGIFLSSGIIKGSLTTQDKIIDTIDIIRHRYQYSGYVHLKIMPGVDYEQLHRAMQLADRVSVNLEGPTQERLSALAPKKDFIGELLKMLQWTHTIRQEYPYQKLASTVTQFVVGAVGDTDQELLSISQQLYRKLGLKRAYYSSFSPVEQTPFENLIPTNPLREHRLYQASFLLRDYEWGIEELLFLNDGNLQIDLDPKRAWADQYLRSSPIDLMKASRRQLLRVPGIGPKGAETIMRARKTGNLTDLTHLRKLHIHAPEQAAPYILLSGRRPLSQMSFF